MQKGRPRAMLDRRTVLGRLFPAPEDCLFVSGLAGSARDAAQLTGDGDNLFTMAGTMGAAVLMGLGMALAAPHRRVVVVTDDGELLMNIGALATVAPDNLSVVCIDNGCHGETGGQTGHTAHSTDLAKMAAGAGLASTLTLSEEVGLDGARKFLADAPAPRFLLVRGSAGPPAEFKRDMDPAACRLRFRNAYLAGR